MNFFRPSNIYIYIYIYWLLMDVWLNHRLWFDYIILQGVLCFVVTKNNLEVWVIWCQNQVEGLEECL